MDINEHNARLAFIAARDAELDGRTLPTVAVEYVGTDRRNAADMEQMLQDLQVWKRTTAARYVGRKHKLRAMVDAGLMPDWLARQAARQVRALRAAWRVLHRETIDIRKGV